MGLPEVLLIEARESAARAVALERLAAEVESEARPLATVLDPVGRRLSPEVWRGAAASAAGLALAGTTARVTDLAERLVALAAVLRRQAADHSDGAQALQSQAEQVRRQQPVVGRP